MNKITFRQDRCKGCGLCVDACPKHLLALNAQTVNAKGYHAAYIADQSACIACAMCAVMCPDLVITVEKEDR